MIMSWDADLEVTVDGHVMNVGSWNYTHNTNKMIWAALGEDPKIRDHFLVGRCWWEPIHRKPAAEGAAFLRAIVEKLRADPDKFRAMNPSNKWGDYDQLVELLSEMAHTADKWPSAVWDVTG